VLRSSHLVPGEAAFIMMGLVPNRKGQPLLVDWQAVCRSPQGDFRCEGYEAFLDRAKLSAGSLVNAEKSEEIDALQAVLPEAVGKMREHMLKREAAFASKTANRIAGTLSDLERLQARQIEQLALRLEEQAVPQGVKQTRSQRRGEEIRKVFDTYRSWVEDTLKTEPEPYIRVSAVVTR
jgi:hypothetical protein